MQAAARVSLVSDRQIQQGVLLDDTFPCGLIPDVALFAGLRQGEMLALRWADVNFENRQIAVSRKVIHLPRQGFVFGEPKARSKRTLVVPDVRLESLCEVRTRQMSRMKELGTRLQENELIFCRAGGEPIYATTLNRAFTKLQLELGIDPVRWHDLRHTSVSIVIKEGVHSKLIADRMGHSSV